MSDQDSSLPIRTQNNGDAAVKVVDGTTPSQTLGVDASGKVTTKLNDGTGNAITSQTSGAQQALDVGVNVAGVQVDPRAIRALTSADIVTAAQGAPNTSANAWPTKLTDGTNTAAVKAASTAAVATDPSAVVALSPNSPLPAGTNLLGSINQGTSPWITKDQADGPVAPGTAASFSELIGGQFNTALPTLANTQQAAIQLDSSGRIIIRPLTATDVVSANIRDNTGAAFSALNPLPVTITEDNAGTEVNDYATSASLAAAATANHTYTVTALKTGLLTQVECAGSGKIKVVIAVETGVATGVYNTKFVQFNSTSSPNTQLSLRSPITVAAGVRVQVSITNRDLLAQDVYSTIVMQEV